MKLPTTADRVPESTDDAEYEPIRTELEDELFEWMRRTKDPLLEGPVPPSDYDDIVFWEGSDREQS